MGKVDWDNAPSSADFYSCDVFYLYDYDDGVLYRWDDDALVWVESKMVLAYIKDHSSYEERPKDVKQSKYCVKSPSHYQLIDGVESIE